MIYGESMKVVAKGRIEVICGSMFAGNSGELIRRINRAAFANLKIIAFKDSLNDHMTNDYINAHNGKKFHAIALERPEDMELFVT